MLLKIAKDFFCDDLLKNDKIEFGKNIWR